MNTNMSCICTTHVGYGLGLVALTSASASRFWPRLTSLDKHHGEDWAELSSIVGFGLVSLPCPNGILCYDNKRLFMWYSLSTDFIYFVRYCSMQYVKTE